MRVALVSPYSWTYPGGVTRHIEALAAELVRHGHDVRSWRPSIRTTAERLAAPRRAPAARARCPSGSCRSAATIGWDSNGAVSNLARHALGDLDAAPRAARGQFDVVHVHEPVAPVVGWDALTSADAPLVGTFHCYRSRCSPHKVAALLGARRKLNHLHVRIAVSEAAAWTGRRFYGGRYRVIPNGVDAARRAASRAAPRARPASRCGSRSSARRSSARACRCCCAPSRRCARTSPPS